MNTARRARIKLVVSEQAETETIERILRERLRERRERRGALDRRQAHSAKDAHWISVERALKIEGTTDPTRLRMELKKGLPCQFRHRGRWWQSKPLEEVAPLLAVRNPLDLQDGSWELVVHEKYWREWLAKPASASSADVPPPPTEEVVLLPDADEETIRTTIKDDYEKRKKAGEKPLNVNEVITPIKQRLKQMGFYAARKTISKVAHNKEFEDLRERPGATWKTKQKGKIVD